MSLIKKLIPFLLVFSLVFYFVRMSDEYNTRILLADLGGVPWLYASVSTIFGILAAFAIQKEWDAWNALSEAVNGEVDSLEKLYLWSDHFPQKIKGPVQENIKKYTALVIRQWKSTERGEKTPEVDAALKALNDNIYEIFTEAPELMPTSFSLFSNVDAISFVPRTRQQAPHAADPQKHASIRGIPSYTSLHVHRREKHLARVSLYGKCRVPCLLDLYGTSRP